MGTFFCCKIITAGSKVLLALHCCQLFHGPQVLQHTVVPVLSAFATARDTQQSQMLNPLRLPEVDAQCQDRLQLSAPAAIRGLQLLPQMRDWAMFGVLICPGVSHTPWTGNQKQT